MPSIDYRKEETDYSDLDIYLATVLSDFTPIAKNCFLQIDNEFFGNKFALKYCLIFIYALSISKLAIWRNEKY